jgi:hypothetical protein
MIKDIDGAVKKAKDLVEKMKLEEPYKSLTYTKLLEKFLDENKIEDTNVSSVLSSTSTGGSGAEASAYNISKSHINAMTELAKKCNITTDQLKNILDVEDGKFVLLKKIDEKLDSRKQIVASHCIVTAYMKGMNKEWTSSSHLREVVDKNGLGDGGNLSKNLISSGKFRIKGKRKATEYSLTTEGWQEGLQILKDLALNKIN